MMKASTRVWGIAALTMGLSAGAVMADGDTVSRAEYEALRNRLATLEERQAQDTDNWMNERRVAEVRAIVQEVLADAETRASLLQEGMYAGHNGSKFFLASADGGFLMEITGQIQLRHVYNNRNDSSDDHVAGFELRRTKVQFAGHIADPRIRYAVQFAVNRGTNSVDADKITLGYQLTDSLYLWAGEDKGPFLREELISSSRQLAVDRSLVNEVFTIDRVQGVALQWRDKNVLNDMFKVQAMLSDGFRSGEAPASVNAFTQKDAFGANLSDRSVDKRFHRDGSDFAVTARVDARLAGDWRQARDFTSWPEEELAVFVGGAIHYEVGRTGDTLLNNDFLMWTLDGSVEVNGLSLYGAVVAMHTDSETQFAGVRDYDLYGVVVQGAYNIAIGDDSLEPFVRYEHLDFDGAISDAGVNTDDRVNLLTLGANYYLHKHAAKLTLDLVWAFDAVPLDFTGQGVLADSPGEDGQFVVRTQFQLLF